MKRRPFEQALAFVVVIMAPAAREIGTGHPAMILAHE
jgi:hypothetical protein